MLNTLTGMEIVEKADDNLELNLATGCFQKKCIDVDKEGLVHDPLTGQYIEKSESDKPLWPSLLSEPVEKSEREEFELDVPFAKADKAQQIVYGIVYEPDVEDSQGDEANAEEIRKAAHDFLVNSRVLKVMHKGKKLNAEIVESYIAPEDFKLGEQEVKKGSWVIATHVSDKKVWKAIVDGKLTGFSMAGTARSDAA